MSLIVAVGVPYQVEITSTGIPMHETEVEFCILQNDVKYSFPAKIVNDNIFIFTLNDAVSHLMNKTLDYKLFVYYQNARFEADKGSFNLLDKKSFDVKMKKGTDVPVKENNTDVTKKSLSERLHEKASKRPAPAKPQTTPKVTTTAEKVVERKVEATKPTPTPEVTPTTTLADAKKALKESSANKDGDYNDKIKNILAGLSKTATPTNEMVTTATPAISKEQPKGSGSFFSEVDNLRKINEDRKRKKRMKKIINPDD